MKHSLSHLTPAAWKRLFWPLFILTLLLMLALQIIDIPLQTTAAPFGIVSFEFAEDAEHARAIIASWDEHARIHAGFSLGLDYLFMPSYALAISLACLWSVGVFAARSRRRVARLGGALAWLVLAAALFDAVENMALWRLLVGPINDFLPALAWWCAAIKFVLIGLGLLFVLAAVLARLLLSPTVREYA